MSSQHQIDYKIKLNLDVEEALERKGCAFKASVHSCLRLFSNPSKTRPVGIPTQHQRIADAGGSHAADWQMLQFPLSLSPWVVRLHAHPLFIPSSPLTLSVLDMDTSTYFFYFFIFFHKHNHGCVW